MPEPESLSHGWWPGWYMENKMTITWVESNGFSLVLQSISPPRGLCETMETTFNKGQRFLFSFEDGRRFEIPRGGRLEISSD